MTPDWDSIIREYGHDVFGTAYRILGHADDAEDVVQEVFLEAHGMRSPDKVRSWKAVLKRMAGFRAIDRLRRRYPEQPGTFTEPTDRHNGPQDTLAAMELQARLRAALARIPAQQATVFCLKYFEGFGTEQICEATAMSATGVTTALHKAKRRLQELMRESGDNIDE